MKEALIQVITAAIGSLGFQSIFVFVKRMLLPQWQAEQSDGLCILFFPFY